MSAECPAAAGMAPGRHLQEYGVCRAVRKVSVDVLVRLGWAAVVGATRVRVVCWVAGMHAPLRARRPQSDAAGESSEAVLGATSVARPKIRLPAASGCALRGVTRAARGGRQGGRHGPTRFPNKCFTFQVA